MAKISIIERLKQYFHWGLKFVLEDMWRITENEVSGTRQRLINLVKTIYISIRRFIEDDLMSKASALTYSTLLAVVPALALIFAIAKGFGFQNIIQSQLFDYIPAQKEALSHALTFVDAYLNQAQSGVFVGIGLIFLFWTVISLMGNVENVLNDMVQKMKSNADIYYGDIEKNGIITVQKNKATIFNCVYREYMICHQSIFAKREVLCRYPFDIQYRLCADRDWLTKILKNNYTVEYVNKAICKYDITGQSSDPQKFMEESKKVSIKYGGEKAKIFIKVKRYFGKVKNLLLGWF